MPDAEWDARVAALWNEFDSCDETTFRARMDALAAELPVGDAVGCFERAAARDSTGDPEGAEPLYAAALAAGLTGLRRRRASIQLASTIRNLGRPLASVAILEAERARTSDDLDDAVAAFLALALADVGREREALSLALSRLAPHLKRYNRSLANYAAELIAPEG